MTDMIGRLQYEDIEAQYPRSLVSFETGNNRLQAYLYGQGLVVAAHGLEEVANCLKSLILLIRGGVFADGATGSSDSINWMFYSIVLNDIGQLDGFKL